jgi:hypothetical protein
MQASKLISETAAETIDIETDECPMFLIPASRMDLMPPSISPATSVVATVESGDDQSNAG